MSVPPSLRVDGASTPSNFPPLSAAVPEQVVLYNRGKTPNKQLPGESDEEFEKRSRDVKTIVGDRKDPEVGAPDAKKKTRTHGRRR